jgi:ABC-type xylose transport system permease subunit
MHSVNKLLEKSKHLDLVILVCLVYILKFLQLTACETSLSANCLSALWFANSTAVSMACKVQ